MFKSKKDLINYIHINTEKFEDNDLIQAKMLIAISYYENEEKEAVRITGEEFKNILGCSESAVGRAIRELKEQEVITIEYKPRVSGRHFKLSEINIIKWIEFVKNRPKVDKMSIQRNKIEIISFDEMIRRNNEVKLEEEQLLIEA